MLQLVLTILIYLIMVIPVGSYLYHIAAGKHTFADPVLNRVDDVIYKISGIDPHKRWIGKICPGFAWYKRSYDFTGVYDFEDSKYSHFQSQRCRSYGGILIV